MTSKRQLILDTETTGLYPKNGDRLLEFAALEMIDRRLTGNYLHLYVNPDRDIPEEVVAIHGITSEKVANEPKFAGVAKTIAEYLAGAELIIHNAPFDLAFLDMEFRRMKMPPVADIVSGVTDTLLMAKEKYPGQKNSLDALCTRLNVDRSRRVLHGALIDCELLSDVYLGMTRNQFSLDIQAHSDESTQDKTETQALSRPDVLKVIQPTADELSAHETYLDGLDKDSGGSLYRQGHQ